MRTLVAVLVGAGLTLVGAPAAHAAEQAPVTLVVGTRDDSGAESLDRVHTLQTRELTDAVAVDVPANQVTAVTEMLRRDPDVTYVEPDHLAYAAAVTTDDPGFGYQWGLTRTRVTTAWQTTRGASGITVAVVDTGVERLHDLAPRMLTGYDFVNGDTNPDDDNGHGTMTAGVIGATQDNGVGIAGICGACRILPVKVLGANGIGSYSDIAEGIRYAADQGAEIINLSLGGDADSQLLRDAVAYAVAEGSLVIAAAGNDGTPALHYPAAIPSVLAVGGSTGGDGRYAWSNYGAGWVDIAAPGCNPAQDETGALMNFCGTSSATPFTAGVAGLLASIAPQPDAAVIRRALTGSAAPLTGNWVATGRVDAAAAIAQLPAARLDATVPAVSFRFPAAGQAVRGMVGVGALATDDNAVRKVELWAGTGLVGIDTVAPYAFRWSSAGVNANVSLTLKAYDTAGNLTVVRRTVRADNAGPSISLTAPANGYRRIPASAYLTVRAGDPSGVTRLDLVVNGRTVQTYAGATRRFGMRTAPYGKVIRVQVRAYDSLGNARLTPLRTWYR